LFVLQQLADGRARSINQLAVETATDPSTVSGVLKRLVERKLVRRERSRDDARRAEVSLTPAGAALLERAPDAPQAQLMAALTALPLGQRRQVAAGLEEIANYMGGARASLFFEDETAERRRR